MATPLSEAQEVGGIAFKGRLLGAITSHDPDDPFKARHYTELDVYRTQEGRFVVRRNRVRDGDSQEQVRVFVSQRTAQDWLGFGALSIALYRELGWSL